MKGQIQAVSAVLITSIVIGTVATAYVWGTPLLEKREGTAEVQSFENQVQDLKGNIESVARAGEGVSSTVDIDIPDGEIIVNPSNDSIDITTTVDSSPYPESWILIEGQTTQNLSFSEGDYALANQDESGIIAARSRSRGPESTVQYRIEYRNMLDESLGNPNMERINLSTRGSGRSSGNAEININNRGTNQDTVELQSGEEMSRTNTEILIDVN